MWHWISPSLRHSFDARITDAVSARACVRELLAKLGDKFTCVLETAEVNAKAAGRISESNLYAYNRVMANNLGYIGIDWFDHSDIFEQVRERLEGVAHCDGYVVDLRGNGGGLITETTHVLELFIHEAAVCFIDTREKKELTERFIGFTAEHYVNYTEAPGVEPDKSLYLRRPAMVAGKPMVILVDQDTASSAELFTAALRASATNGDIVVMGERTHGKGIGQADFVVHPELTIKISFMRFYSPEGQGQGKGQEEMTVRLAISGIVALVVAGCGGESHQDLREWMRDQGKGALGKLEPLPQIRPYEPFAYNAFDLPDPFKPREVKPAKGNDRLAPDLARRREPLESRSRSNR